MAKSAPKSPVNRVNRIPDRGIYDRETIYKILDRAFLCHVGFQHDHQVYVIPTLYCRRGDTLLLHGSNASRLLQHLGHRNHICIAVTILDGLVLARSAFHHSMNYRSVVVFGWGETIVNVAAKLEALRAISENVSPGRWADVRTPSEQELKATSVVSIGILDGSAKVRQGPPGDDEADYELDIWAGVVPLWRARGLPVPDPRLKPGIAVPEYLKTDAPGVAKAANEKHTLAMKNICEHCHKNLTLDAIAYICSYECTYCVDCTAGFDFICPNCGGELVKRPRRTV
ncbi:MAG: pyridoxamine 5'-phosphate oxidase family protein [Acidobacteria bacterium]|nr:MAG: pyridoxamine 5'-phosphate oxidase family protein [Acidobacteriota bacterium]